MFWRELDVCRELIGDQASTDDDPHQVECCTVRIGQEYSGDEGVVVWDAALVLAKYIERHQHRLKLNGAQVVELGAGTGVVGITAAVLGAKVIITDLQRVVPLMKKNIETNKEFITGSIEAQTLVWGDQTQLKSILETPPTLLLVSDCVYYESSLAPLVSTLSTLASSARILLSYEVRDTEHKRRVHAEFSRLITEAFYVEEIPTAECHPEFASDDIRILSLRRRHDD